MGLCSFAALSGNAAEACPHVRHLISAPWAGGMPVPVGWPCVYVNVCVVSKEKCSHLPSFLHIVSCQLGVIVYVIPYNRNYIIYAVIIAENQQMSIAFLKFPLRKIGGKCWQFPPHAILRVGRGMRRGMVPGRQRWAASARLDDGAGPVSACDVALWGVFSAHMADSVLRTGASGAWMASSCGRYFIPWAFLSRIRHRFPMLFSASPAPAKGAS